MTLATIASPPPSERVSMCAAGRRRTRSSLCAQPDLHLHFDADENKHRQPRLSHLHIERPHVQQQQHGQSGATCREAASPPPPFSPDLVSDDHDHSIHAYEHDDTERHTRGTERRSSTCKPAHRHTSFTDDHDELCHSQRHGGEDSDTQTSSDHEGDNGHRRSSLNVHVCSSAALPLSPDLLLMGDGGEAVWCDGHTHDDDDDGGGGGDDGEDEDDETCMPWDGGSEGGSSFCAGQQELQERAAFDLVDDGVVGGRRDCGRSVGGSRGGDRGSDRDRDGVNGARREDADTSTVLEGSQHCGPFEPSATNDLLPTSRDKCSVEHSGHPSTLQSVHSDVHRERNGRRFHSTDGDRCAVNKDVEGEEDDVVDAGERDTRQEEESHASEPMGIVTRSLRRLSLEEDPPALARPGQLQLKRRRHRADTYTDAPRRSSEAKRLREWMTEREGQCDTGRYACGRHQHHQEIGADDGGHGGGGYVPRGGGGRLRRRGGDEDSGSRGRSGGESDDGGGWREGKGRKAEGKTRRRPLAPMDLNDSSTYPPHPLPISGGVIVMVTPGPEEERRECALCLTAHGRSDQCLGVDSHATVEKMSLGRGRRRAVGMQTAVDAVGGKARGSRARWGCHRVDGCGGGDDSGIFADAAAAAEGFLDHQPMGSTAKASTRATNRPKTTASIFHRFLHSASKPPPPSALPAATPNVGLQRKSSSTTTTTTTTSSSAASASRSVAHTTPHTFITALLPHLSTAPVAEDDQDGAPTHPCCHFVGGTLVVTSRAGLKVWEAALREWRRTTGGDVDGPSFIVYSMGARDRSMLPPRSLSHAAIVLTTYEILQAKEVSLRRPVAAGGWLADLHVSDDGTRPILGSRLMQVEWRRLVVDDGQRLARANSASAALAKVHARRRWLLLDWEAVVIGSSRAAAKAGVTRGAWGPSDDLKVMGLLRAVWASSIPDHDFTWPDLVATSAAVGLFRIGGVRGV